MDDLTLQLLEKRISGPDRCLVMGLYTRGNQHVEHAQNQAPHINSLLMRSSPLPAHGILDT